MKTKTFETYFQFFFDLSKFVLFHNKKSIIPGDNKDRHILIAENMEGDVIRKKNYCYFLHNEFLKLLTVSLLILYLAKFHVFERHLTKHACFQDNLKRSGVEWFVKTKRFPEPEDVNRVRADRLTGWVLPLR